ncbi:hypothetical protein [Pigmentiphaga sp.]|nr:hypothetical protein [Pigmentiphaga sp.]
MERSRIGAHDSTRRAVTRVEQGWCEVVGADTARRSDSMRLG